MLDAHDRTGSVFGGLAELLFDFCHIEKIQPPKRLNELRQVERFSFSTWVELLNEIHQQQPETALGLKIARLIKPKHLGILGYIALTCETVGEALQRFHDLNRLLYDGSPLTAHIQDGQLSIGWTSVPFHLTTQLSNELAIAIVVQMLTESMDFPSIRLTEIHFTHPAPDSTSIFEQFFRCPVKFSQPAALLKLPVQELALPLRHSDRTLLELLLKQAHETLKQLPNTTQLDLRLQQEIVIGLQKNHCQIEQVAQKLNMSTRQLQRYLQQQNLSFQQRVQEVRQILAEQYLRDPHLSLQEIALLLNYSEQSAFQRAFKQWHNMTPQQWRQNQKNPKQSSSNAISFEI